MPRVAHAFERIAERESLGVGTGSTVALSLGRTGRPIANPGHELIAARMTADVRQRASLDHATVAEVH